VPIYLADSLKPELPMRAIVSARPEAEWTLIDGGYDFLFSLYPNDFVVITFRDKPSISGYYAGADRSTGAVSVRAHDRSPSAVKDGLYRGIGVKTALSIEKYHVDVLGRCYPAGREVRRDLAQYRR
jgi:CRISPR-associated endonuclease Csn1